VSKDSRVSDNGKCLPTRGEEINLTILNLIYLYLNKPEVLAEYVKRIKRTKRSDNYSCTK